MIKRFCISILILFVVGPCFAGSDLNFTEEDLSFGIADSVLTVSGIYYFSADHAGNRAILYPFPEEDAMGDPYDITVMDMQKGEELAFSPVNDSRSIRFVVSADEDTPVLITYKQRLYDNYARYILLSTHTWGKSLGRVEYKLKVPENIRITHFSIPPDLEVSLDLSRLYLWQREDFMPDCDLLFEFESK